MRVEGGHVRRAVYCAAALGGAACVAEAFGEGRSGPGPPSIVCGRFAWSG